LMKADTANSVPISNPTQTVVAMYKNPVILHS
jgi:hypothetical protein